MNDRPDAGELLGAVADFLREDVVPALGGKLRYNARVAANVVEMVQRELVLEEGHLRGEWERLVSLDDSGGEPLPGDRDQLKRRIRERTEALVGRIRDGEADSGPWRERLISHLRQTVADKLEVAKGR